MERKVVYIEMVDSKVLEMSVSLPTVEYIDLVMRNKDIDTIVLLDLSKDEMNYIKKEYIKRVTIQKYKNLRPE